MRLPGDKEIDTCGYSATTIQMMVGRHAAGNARFFLPYLRADMHVLDCGCGPGSITVDLAEVVASGEVVGVDLAPSHIALARAQAAQRGITNVRFAVGNVLQLPFPDATFDAAFGHTILIQLPNPCSALTEVYRVVKSGGVIGFRESAFDGNLYEPAEGARQQFFTLLIRMFQHTGRDLRVGRRLGGLVGRAGFRRVTMSASYDSVGTAEAKQGGYERDARRCDDVWMEQAIALGWISRDARDRLSAALRAEGGDPAAFSATAFCEVVGWKDTDTRA
jgi:ubiquinone/menaquinone biosynthesis C-methylase UbiE